VRVHRSRTLADYERRVVDRIPVTSFARTLVDCSGRLSLGQLARALDAGLIRHDVTLWSLERSLTALRQAPGRHPAKLWTLLGERGSESESAESPREMRLARALREAGLPAPVPQHWVRVGEDRFRLDFAYPDALIAIEYDGWDPHRSRTAFDHDRRRDRLLQLAGWRVLRFTSQSSDDEIVSTLRPLVREGA
jgi:very-short-patch-repair endonuclease